MFDIITIGGATVDISMRISESPKPDKEISASSLGIFCGGSAANTSVGLSRLGLKSTFIGRIGKDYFGRLLADEFRKEGVNVSQLKKVDVPTAVVLSLIDKHGERYLVWHRGATAELCPKDIDSKYISKARHLHMTSLEGKRTRDVLVRAKNIAKRNGLTVSLDPGTILAKYGAAKLSPLLSGIDIIFPSRNELYMLAKKKNMAAACKTLLKYAKAVVVTCGSKGAFVYTKNKSFWSCTKKRNAVDTTGAGDAFVSGFLYGFLKGETLEKCAALGNACAYLKIGKFGARSGMPTLHELKIKFPMLMRQL